MMQAYSSSKTLSTMCCMSSSAAPPNFFSIGNFSATCFKASCQPPALPALLLLGLCTQWLRGFRIGGQNKHAYEAAHVPSNEPCLRHKFDHSKGVPLIPHICRTMPDLQVIVVVTSTPRALGPARPDDLASGLHQLHFRMRMHSHDTPVTDVACWQRMRETSAQFDASSALCWTVPPTTHQPGAGPLRWRPLFYKSVAALSELLVGLPPT